VKSSLTRFVVVLLIAGLFFGAVSNVSAAPLDNTPINLELTDVDAQAAITMLFKSRGLNYTIDPDVTGVIRNLSFKDIPFDTALKSLLKSAGAVYRIDENNVYTISKKPPVTSLSTSPSPGPETLVEAPVTEETMIEKISLNHVGASELLQMISGSGSTGTVNGFGNYGTFGNTNFGGSSFGSSSSFGSGSSSFGSGSSYGSSSSYGGRNW